MFSNNEMMRFTYIYALVDPRTLKVRYIGKSDDPKRRFANQLNERSNTYRCHWIQSLRSVGLKPLQEILEVVPIDRWKEAERNWIACGTRCGWPLTNGTSGGDGVSDLSRESKQRIRDGWVGKEHTSEAKAKIGSASRGRRHTPEWSAHMSQVMKNRGFSTVHRQRIRESIQKLTDDQVQEIRALLADGISQYVIADRFGVHQGTVSNIHRGKSYGSVPEIVDTPRNRRPLTDEQVREIRAMLNNGDMHTEIAERFGVNRVTIGYIKRGITYKDVPL